MTNLQAFTTDNKNWFCLPAIGLIPTEWRQKLFSNKSQPFTSFEFLSSLEQTQCIGEKSGWLPKYFVYQTDDELGLLLCFEKHNSYGEYVFDWAWADAYHRNGIDYYPKLLCGIPFSPIPCSKWLGNNTLTELDAFKQVAALKHDIEYTGFHYIYPNSSIENQDPFWSSREGHQFHWFNQNQFEQPYLNFEQYLDSMTARKRKNIKKERQKVQDSGVECYWQSGDKVTANELSHFYHCYHLTYLKRGQSGYLNQAFFELLCQQLGSQVQILFCKKQQQIIAAALYIVSEDTLYGRYWGSLENADFVHFEACYYQGIEYAIAHKLKLFNPGTQGEHKISRGFKPTLTHSYHHLTLPPFHQAVQQFCQEEKHHNQLYMKQCEQKLPFKQPE